MHFITVKGILSAQNGMNLYRGCTHGCIYCDSRSKCYQMDHVFEDVAVKENALVLLENKLRSKKEKGMIAMGSMCDPYMDLEKSLQYTRRALEIIEKYGFGITLITKSDMVLRDLDILKRINKKTKCVIQMTLTTYDEELCKILEPDVCSTKSRLNALKTLAKENIPTIVWLCPILPFINDTKDNIEGILNYCIEAKAKGILCFGMGLTLREGNREYFYEQLDKHFPKLKEKYIKTYGNRYVLNSLKNDELMKIFKTKCDENKIMSDPQAIFKYLKEFDKKENIQLNLFE